MTGKTTITKMNIKNDHNDHENRYIMFTVKKLMSNSLNRRMFKVNYESKTVYSSF